MDVAYNQHANAARRKNRSTTNLNHLTLAPLTSKLPLTDHDDLPDPLSAPLYHSASYLQGKSAPTTPRLLSRSPAPGGGGGRSFSSHARGSSTPGAGFHKSKSATHLAVARGHRATRSSVSGATTPTMGKRRRGDHNDPLSAKDNSDTDWLLRAGALISTETRESKGQAWLVSRASSTSLAGLRDAEEEAFEREVAREREIASRNRSRRGSVAMVDDDPMGSSPSSSRFGSRSQSCVGSRSQTGFLSPLDHPLHGRPVDGYFPAVAGGDDDYIAGPDFVNLDEQLEAIGGSGDGELQQDTSIDDEATVRRLVKGGNRGITSWFGNMLGFQLFSVDEHEEEGGVDEQDESDDIDDDDDDIDGEDDEDDMDGTSEGRVVHKPQRSNLCQFEGAVSNLEEDMPAPKANEGGWQDAAWLLSVASKVLL